jgi:hypothetical protein
MLKLVKHGGKLENRDLNKVRGGAGDCGINSCNSCGEVGNDNDFKKGYESWKNGANW